MDFQQQKTGRDNYTVINDDIIGKIAQVQAFEDAMMNNMLYMHHKELLKYAKNKNRHKEVGFFGILTT